MDTIIKRIDTSTSQEVRKEIVEQAGEIIKNAGLVAFPTETVYGLGADALNELAASSIYEAKGRPSDNPLIVHISKLKDLEVVASDIPDEAMLLAEAFWPGPLTMVFNKTPLVPYATTGGLDTVAVRMPENEVAREIIEAAGGFVAAPSANTSGKPSPTDAKHVIEDMMGRIDMIVDAGNCQIGLESTIVDLSCEVPVILRPGMITPSQIEGIIGRVEFHSEANQENSEAPKAPGMKYRHYAPKAELSLFAGRAESVANRINLMVEECINNQKKVGIICSEETGDLYPKGELRVIGSLSDSKDIAAHLYAILRDFDSLNMDYIFSETFFVGELGDAIMNRLSKAASGKIFICSVDIDYSKIKDLLFVDENDLCLAPMAAAVFSSFPGTKNLSIDSRGLSVLFSEPVNPKAEMILKQHGIKGVKSKAVRLTEKDVDSHTIVALSSKVKSRIMDKFENADYVYTLSELLDDMVVIENPFGGSLSDYEACFLEIRTALRRLKDLIVG